MTLRVAFRWQGWVGVDDERLQALLRSPSLSSPGRQHGFVMARTTHGWVAILALALCPAAALADGAFPAAADSPARVAIRLSGDRGADGSYVSEPTVGGNGPQLMAPANDAGTAAREQVMQPQVQAPALRSQFTPAMQPAREVTQQPSAPAAAMNSQLATSVTPTNVGAQPAMQAVADRVNQMCGRALVSAQRAAFYTARAELVESLGLIAQARDLQRGTGEHTAALASGLTAMKEAADFSPTAGKPATAIDVRQIAATHKTPLLRETKEMISPLSAQQQYYNFAQQQLAIAVGGEPAASQPLYLLGKLQTALAGQDSRSLAAPQAMVFYQASLAANSKNYLAANELGVLLAQFGQLPDARRVLLHSVSTRPHAEGWHNLAVVHERLGEAELARLATHEFRLASGQSVQPKMAGGSRVEWVDARTFAASGSGGSTEWPSQQPGKPQTAGRPPTNISRR